MEDGWNMADKMSKSYSILLGNKRSKPLKIFMLRSHRICSLRFFDEFLHVVHTVHRWIHTTATQLFFNPVDETERNLSGNPKHQESKCWLRALRLPSDWLCGPRPNIYGSRCQQLADSLIGYQLCPNGPIVWKKANNQVFKHSFPASHACPNMAIVNERQKPWDEMNSRSYSWQVLHVIEMGYIVQSY